MYKPSLSDKVRKELQDKKKAGSWQKGLALGVCRKMRSISVMSNPFVLWWLPEGHGWQRCSGWPAKPLWPASAVGLHMFKTP